MTVTPRTAARQITVSRQQREERARVALVAPRTRLAYSTSTGDSPRQETVQQRRVNCPELAQWGEHVMVDVEADLPGDRSVGYCSCGQYIDTGTFDERN